MSATLKTRLADVEKCQPVPTSAVDPPYSRPWMAGFIADALKTADVPGSLKRHDVGWGDYARFRRTDPAFLSACQEIDLVVKQALWIQLEARASTGDVRALKLLAGGLESIRQTLEAAGVGPTDLAPVAERTDFDLIRIGPYALPLGPCACCARGLMIHDLDANTGQFQHVLVRHEIMRSLDVPPYPDKDDIAIVYGFDPTDPRHHRAKYPARSADVNPHFVLPAHTGPTRAELWEEAAARGNGMLSPHPGDDHSPSFVEDAASYLPLDFPAGEDPPTQFVHLYGQVVSLDGNGLVWKMLTEHRGVKHAR